MWQYCSRSNKNRSISNDQKKSNLEEPKVDTMSFDFKIDKSKCKKLQKSKISDKKKEKCVTEINRTKINNIGENNE